MHKFKKTLDQDNIAYGMFLGLKDPAIVEIAGIAGHDFVVIDFEHSTLDFQTLEHMVRASNTRNISSVVRIPQEDYSSILRVLESGADAIMIPHVTTKQQMEKIVNLAKYPPFGKRGIDDSTRIAKFGTVPLLQHMDSQNNRVLVIAMIEDAAALDNLEEIFEVEGLDLVFIGLADLIVSMGLHNSNEQIKIDDVIHTIIQKATNAGVKVGMSAANVDRIKEVVNKGVKFVTSPDVDVLHLTETLSEHLKNIKSSIV